MSLASRFAPDVSPVICYSGSSDEIDCTYFQNRGIAPFRLFSVDGGHTIVGFHN